MMGLRHDNLAVARVAVVRRRCPAPIGASPSCSTPAPRGPSASTARSPPRRPSPPSAERRRGLRPARPLLRPGHPEIYKARPAASAPPAPRAHQHPRGPRRLRPRRRPRRRRPTGRHPARARVLRRHRHRRRHASSAPSRPPPALASAASSASTRSSTAASRTPSTLKPDHHRRPPPTGVVARRPPPLATRPQAHQHHPPDMKVSVPGAAGCGPTPRGRCSPATRPSSTPTSPPTAAMRVVLTGEDTHRRQRPHHPRRAPAARARLGRRPHRAPHQPALALPASDTDGRDALQQQIIEPLDPLPRAQRLHRPARARDRVRLPALRHRPQRAHRHPHRRRQRQELSLLNRERSANPDPNEPRTREEGNAIPQMARNFDPEMAASQAGILGVMQPQSGHFLASPYGGAFAVGNDDADVWGGLTGTEIGEAYGVGGLGLVGTGRGGGGTGEGTIGLGNTGLIGKGGGGGSGSATAAAPAPASAAAAPACPTSARPRPRSGRARQGHHPPHRPRPHQRGPLLLQPGLAATPTGQGPRRHPVHIGRPARSRRRGPGDDDEGRRGRQLHRPGVKPLDLPQAQGGGQRHRSPTRSCSSRRRPPPGVRSPTASSAVNPPPASMPRGPNAGGPGPRGPPRERRQRREEAARQPSRRTASPYTGEMFEHHDPDQGRQPRQPSPAPSPGTTRTPATCSPCSRSARSSRPPAPREAARAYGSIIDLFPATAPTSAATPAPASSASATPASSSPSTPSPRPSPSAPTTPPATASSPTPSPAPAATPRPSRRSSPASPSLPAGRFRGVDRILREDAAILAAAARRRPRQREGRQGRARQASHHHRHRPLPPLRPQLGDRRQRRRLPHHRRQGRGGLLRRPQAPLRRRALRRRDHRLRPRVLRHPRQAAAPSPTSSPAHYFSRGPMGYGMGKLAGRPARRQGRAQVRRAPLRHHAGRRLRQLGTVTGPL
jgi:hypothetical protein